MRWACLVIVLLVAAPAAAQPVSFALQQNVEVGKKPQIRLSAAVKVTDVRVELDRGDGKHFQMRQPSLAKGQTVTLAIGDGMVGKASYKGTVSAQIPGDKERWSETLTFDTMVHAPVHVGYDIEHLDLDKHVLQFMPSRGVQSADVVALGEDGAELGKGTATYTASASREWLPITWTQPAGKRVLMLKLRVVATDGSATDVELVPWSETIDHEDVSFATDSAAIEASEESKLAASVVKIAEIVKRTEKLVKMKLYVAGHTDTVGPAAKNRTLSLARARAIATYFRKHGIALPIVYAGYGESVLKVKTPDETDERANRRADYVIGPVGAPPPFKGPYIQPHLISWQELR